MRYIDADKVMEEVNRIGGHNLCEWQTIGVKALIDRQPTADVVPKSEVEEIFREIEKLTPKKFTEKSQDFEFGYALAIQQIKNKIAELKKKYT